MKKILKYLLSVALAGVLLWLALRSVDWTAFLEGLKLTRWVCLIPFLVASVGALAFRTFRWRLLLKTSAYPMKWFDVWDANNVGNVANLAIPSSGEFVRCAYVAGKKGYANVLGTALMERVWDFLAIVILCVLALVLDRNRFGAFLAEHVWAPLSSGGFALWWLVVLIVLLIALFFWAVFHFRERVGFFQKTADAFAAVGKGFTSFLGMKQKGLFLLYTVGIWVMYLMMSYSIQLAVPALSELSLVDALFFTAVGNIASVVPVPGGIGAYHYLLALSISSIYGKTWETGILFATLQHELHAVLILVLGAVGYARLSLRSRNQRP